MFTVVSVFECILFENTHMNRHTYAIYDIERETCVLPKSTVCVYV